MSSSACREQPGGLRAFWLSGSCFLLWDGGIVPHQSPLLRRGVLMGARLRLGKDHGLSEDQEKGT